MRRTAGMVLGLCLAATLAGVATAAVRPPGGSHLETAVAVGPAGGSDPEAAAVAPLGGESMTAGGAEAAGARPADIGGRLEIGTIEQVSQTLSYLSARTRTLRYPGASYVKVHLTRARLLPGDYLTVADGTGEEVHRYDGGLLASDRWAMSVTGDTAVVTLHTPADPLGMRGSLAGLGAGVDRVARGYSPAELGSPRPAPPHAAAPARRPAPSPAVAPAGRPAPSPHPAAPAGREESLCGGDDKSDAVCYRERDPVLYKRSKAVARLLINGVELCTAWRVGPNNRLLTNHHCFAETRDAHNTEVWFNYQCAACGGYSVFRSTKVWADQVVATDDTLDFTLFSVDDFDSVKKFGYLDLDPRRPVAGDKVYIPQHPRGEPTMVATASDQDTSGNCAVDDPSFPGYADASDVSYYCDTEGGSSGSPVLSRTSHKVIALHHFGGCPNSGVRIDIIQRRVASLL